MNLLKNMSLIIIGMNLIHTTYLYAQEQLTASYLEQIKMEAPLLNYTFEPLQFFQQEERPKLDLKAIEKPLLEAITNNFEWPTTFSHLSFFDEDALPRPVNCPKHHRGFECITSIGSEWIARVHYTIAHFVGSTPETCFLSFGILYDTEMDLNKSVLLYAITCGHEFVQDKQGFIQLTEDHFVQ